MRHKHERNHFSKSGNQKCFWRGTSVNIAHLIWIEHKCEPATHRVHWHHLSALWEEIRDLLLLLLSVVVNCGWAAASFPYATCPSDAPAASHSACVQVYHHRCQTERATQTQGNYESQRGSGSADNTVLMKNCYLFSSFQAVSRMRATDSARIPRLHMFIMFLMETQLVPLFLQKFWRRRVFF